MHRKMILIALALLLLQKLVLGSQTTYYAFAAKGSEALLYYNATIAKEKFFCDKGVVELNFTDRYSVRTTDKSTIFVISNVSESDHGEYTCGNTETRDYVSYTLTVVGPVSMSVQQMKNSVDVTCEVTVTKDEDVRFAPGYFSLELLVNGNETKKVDIGNLDHQITNYKGDLDPSIEVQNLTCQASYSAFGFKTSVTKQVNVSYQLDVVIAKSQGNAVFYFKGPVTPENFTCSRYGRELYLSGRFSANFTPAGEVYVTVANVVTADYGEYICKNKATGEYVVYTLVVVGPVRMNLQQNKNHVEVTCDGAIAKQKGLAYALYNLSLQILINENLVNKEDLIFEFESKTTRLNYVGDLDTSIEVQNVTCAIRNNDFSFGETRQVNISGATARPPTHQTSQSPIHPSVQSTADPNDINPLDPGSTVPSVTTTKPDSSSRGGASGVLSCDHFLVILLSGLLALLFSARVR